MEKLSTFAACINITRLYIRIAMIDGHGDDLFRYGNLIKVNFSSNVPQHVDHSGLLAHLATKESMLGNYPEPAPRSVESRLAQVHGIADGNVIVTNGATEAIYLLAHAFIGGRSEIVAPTFSEYQDACGVNGHSVHFISTLRDIRPDADMVWLCNPNNPTGCVFDRHELLSVIDNHQSSLFVVDQAYASFSVKEVLSTADVMNRRNVVVLHSLTKRFVVPGLRIGYAVGATDVMSRMRSLRMPWSVNSVAIESALYLLDNADEYRVDSHALHSEACRLAEAVRRQGIRVHDTDCNFLLARLPGRAACELKDWLISNHGLLIRDASNFEGLTPGHFRVAAQSPRENDLLINALRQWISL